MNIFQEIGIAILVYFAISLGIGLKGYKLKMRMKQFGNGMVWIGGVILALYIVLLGMMLIPKVAILVQDSLFRYSYEADTVLVLRELPTAFIVMLFIGVVWFLSKAFSCKPFKFNDEEKQFLAEKRAKFYSKIRKVFGLKEKEKKV